MIRVALPAFLALLLLPLLGRVAAQEKGEGSVEEQFLALRKEWQAALKEVEGDEKKRKVSNTFASRFFAIASKRPKDEATPDALLWILINAPQSAEMPNAAKMLENQHLQSTRLKPKLQVIHSTAPEIEHYLRAVMSKHTDKDTQGIACYALAQLLREKAGDDHPKIRQESIGLLETCVKKYSDCKLTDKGPTIGDRAGPLLFEMKFLVIGKTVPDIVGEDMEGKKLKLSDQRGRVVMLSFWATWCPYCMKLVPHEKELVKRLEGKPFVLIGVNGDAAGDKKKVLQRIEKEQIPWRTFWGGAIPGKWNIEYWPAIFIIDHDGVIRHRFGYTDDFAEYDRAINSLITAAQKKPR